MRRALAKRHIAAITLLALAAVFGIAAGFAYACPAPLITSKPADPTRSAGARFSFTDSENGLIFMCSLDGSGYQPCSSPKSYGGLSARRHTFSVLARNASGGTSASSSYSWTIHRQPPSIHIGFPGAGRSYNQRGWSAGCSRRGGLCGTARDSAGVAVVLVSIRQNATGRYWNGRKFATRQQVYLRARLSAPQQGRTASTSRNWRYALALPRPDGGYTVQVRAKDKLGNLTRRRAAVRAGFQTDTVPPTVAFTSYPSNPSTSTAASFTFRANQPVKYVCSMGAHSSSCSSPASYNNLGPGLYSFSVRAFDAAGNSSAIHYSWWVVKPAKVDLSGGLISSGGVLFPGNVGQPIAARLSNPNDVTIWVTAVTVSIQSTNAPGCSPAWFATTPASIPPGGVMVPPHSSVTLPAQGAVGPSVRLVESGTNQDACQGATLTLAYGGSAHS